MATWVDGAEYAPTERPDGFATPRTEPLSAAPAELNPADAQPAERPTEFSASSPGVPLDRLVPSAAPTRNPTIPFQTMAVVGADSAWGSLASAHTARAWTPQQPIATSASGFGTTQTAAPPSYPPPAGAPSYPAPTGGPSFPAPTPTGTTNVPAPTYPQSPDVLQEPQPMGRLQTTTPLVLVLLLAGFIQMISPVLFATAFALALATGKGRKVTIPTFTVMSFVILFFGVLGFADGSSWELMSTASIGASWLTLIAVVFSGLSGGGRGTTRR